MSLRSRILGIALLLAAGCGRAGLFPDQPGQSPTPVADGFRKSLTISSAEVSSQLTDFPVLVSLVDSDLRDHADAAGDTLFFADTTGTPLDYEVEQWDPATGTLRAWVRVPALSDAAATVFHIYYGGTVTGVAENPAGVWTADFVAVWHMSGDPSEELADSLGDFPATGQAMSSNDEVAGQIGNAIQFNGNNDEVRFGNPLPGQGPHTMSAWVDQDNTNDNDALIVIGNGSQNEARWFHSRYFGGPAAVGFYANDWDDIGNGADIQNDGWTLVHWVYDTQAVSHLYVNGQSVGGAHQHPGSQNCQGNVGRFGNAPGSFGQDMGLNGTLDEVHLSDIARSPGWIAAEFANQSDPSAFVQVGPEEDL